MAGRARSKSAGRGGTGSCAGAPDGSAPRLPQLVQKMMPAGLSHPQLPQRMSPAVNRGRGGPVKVRQRFHRLRKRCRPSRPPGSGLGSASPGTGHLHHGQADLQHHALGEHAVLAAQDAVALGSEGAMRENPQAETHPQAESGAQLTSPPAKTSARTPTVATRNVSP